MFLKIDHVEEQKKKQENAKCKAKTTAARAARKEKTLNGSAIPTESVRMDRGLEAIDLMAGKRDA